MSAQAQKQEHKAKPGDLIKIYCKGYQHWVVYIGDDEVVSFPGPKDENVDGAIPSLVNGEAEVTREKIWDVIGDSQFRVSNLWDKKKKPHKKAVIVKEACKRVGQKLEYCWSDYNSEQFAKELRYGDQVFHQPSQFEQWTVPAKKQRVETPLDIKPGERHARAFRCERTHDAKPGDLIEFFRWCYRHWAVYVGNNEVVGLTSPNQGDGVLQNLINGEALVKRESLWDVMGKDDCRVNNLWDDDCEPYKAEEVVKKTLEMVGRTLRYSLLSHNCEHFATELRYGEAKSKQVYFYTLGFWS